MPAKREFRLWRSDGNVGSWRQAAEGNDVLSSVPVTRLSASDANCGHSRRRGNAGSQTPLMLGFTELDGGCDWATLPEKIKIKPISESPTKVLL
jgi:hypothetical protein